MSKVVTVLAAASLFLGCGGGGYDTVRDGVVALSAAQCQRFDECSEFDIDVNDCIDSVVRAICQTTDCNAAVASSDDAIDDCIAALEVAECDALETPAICVGVL